MGPSRRTPRWSDDQGYLMVALLVGDVGDGDHDGRGAAGMAHPGAAREGSRAGFQGRAVCAGDRALSASASRMRRSPSIDFLVEQRFLRKKYKDPITERRLRAVESGAGGGTGWCRARFNVRKARCSRTAGSRRWCCGPGPDGWRGDPGSRRCRNTGPRKRGCRRHRGRDQQESTEVVSPVQRTRHV